jgi:hypothetical protein
MRLSTSLPLALAALLNTAPAHCTPHAKDESAIEFAGLTITPATKVIHVKWLVQRERGGQRFRIEKSLDQAHWSTVAEVASIGNHEELHTYMTSAINLPEALNEFFRLIREDRAGNIRILGEASITHAALSGLILIPNRNSGKEEIVFSCSSLIDTKVHLSLMDLDGKVKRSEKHNFTVGYNRLLISTEQLPEGTYMLVLIDETGERQTRTFTTSKATRRKAKF